MSMYGKFPKINGKEQRAKPKTDFTGDKGFTVQADRDEADINKIIARLEKGANLARLNSKPPFYGDVSDLGGLDEAIMKVQKAEKMFMDIPANVRERFDNDPVKYVEFFQDPANIDEAIKLGLALPKPVIKEEVPNPTPGNPA